MRRNDKKKMNTGLRQILRRRMALGAVADVILIFEMLRARKEAVWPNGWKLLEAGLHLESWE